MATKSNLCLTTSKPMQFNVIRRSPKLIPPEKSTPYEFKQLSDIDSQQELQILVPFISFYPSKSNQNDPIETIKKALSKALVPYYPLAGRLREKEEKRLVVECNGEGILFIEANAPDTSLDNFLQDRNLLTPVTSFDNLFYKMPNFSILHSPLLIIQVTRLKCGGFVLALDMNHVMLDVAGLIQFMKAVAELAQEANSLSVCPIWERHLLCARNPPRITCVLPPYENIYDLNTNTSIHPINYNSMVYKSFSFGPTEISTLRRLVPSHIKFVTTFELISACIWRCRTIAIQPNPEELIHLIFSFNGCSKFRNLIPPGYYGNAFVPSMVITTAAKLCHNSFDYAIQLIKKAKDDVDEEFFRSFIDMTKGRLNLNRVQCFAITDHSKDGFNFNNVDYGWGKPVYAGPTLNGVARDMSYMFSYFVSFENCKGEKGIMIPICLPGPTMKRFTKELHEMFD